MTPPLISLPPAVTRVFSALWPQPLLRGAEQQRAVDRASARLALYETVCCPYCLRVRRAMRRLNLQIERRNVARDRERAGELRIQGGLGQVPCLRIDDGRGGVRWLYESAEIVRYLEQRFGASSG